MIHKKIRLVASPAVLIAAGWLPLSAAIADVQPQHCLDNFERHHGH